MMLGMGCRALGGKAIGSVCFVGCVRMIFICGGMLCPIMSIN